MGNLVDAPPWPQRCDVMACMEPLERHTSASVDEVWQVLADGWTYPVWVVGASRMRAVSANWPEVGAKLHHSAGMWPAMLDDETTVEACEPGRRLRMLPKGRPVGTAVVEITLEAHGSGATIRILEDVISGPARLVPERLRQVGVVARNRETLHRLALLAERNTTP